MQLDAQRLSAMLNMPELAVYVYDMLDSTNDACRRKLAAGEGPCACGHLIMEDNRSFLLHFFGYINFA